MRIRKPCRDSSCAGSSGPKGPQHPGPIGQRSALRSAAPPPVRRHQTSPLARVLQKGRQGMARKGRGAGSRKGLHPAYSSRGGAGPSLSRVNAAHTLLTGPPCSERKNGEDQSRRRLAGEPGISQGGRVGVRALGRARGVQRGPAAPLATLNKRPNAWGSPCPSGGRRATTALPSVLCQWARPREVPENLSEI